MYEATRTRASARMNLDDRAAAGTCQVSPPIRWIFSDLWSCQLRADALRPSALDFYFVRTTCTHYRDDSGDIDERCVCVFCVFIPVLVVRRFQIRTKELSQLASAASLYTAQMIDSALSPTTEFYPEFLSALGDPALVGDPVFYMQWQWQDNPPTTPTYHPQHDAGGVCSRTNWFPDSVQPQARKLIRRATEEPWLRNFGRFSYSFRRPNDKQNPDHDRSRCAALPYLFSDIE